VSKVGFLPRRLQLDSIATNGDREDAVLAPAASVEVRVRTLDGKPVTACVAGGLRLTALGAGITWSYALNASAFPSAALGAPRGEVTLQLSGDDGSEWSGTVTVE
jgi:hypothetical protein